MTAKIAFLQKNSILLLIGFIILLIFASSVTAFYSRMGAVQHQQKKDALLKARNSLERVWNQVHLADISFRGYATIQDEKFLEPYTKAVEGHQLYLDSLSYYLSEQGYTEEALIVDNEQSIKRYISLVGRMIDLTKQERKEEALAIFKSDPGYDVWITYDKFSKGVLEYVSQSETDAQQQYDINQLYTGVVQGMLLLIGIPVLIVVILQLQRNKRTRQQLLVQLDNSNREFVYNDGQALDSYEAAQITRHLTRNLEKVVDFIRNLGEERSEWNELDANQRERNKNTLVGELLKMEEKLKQIKQTDEQRLWSTEGEGKIAEIARTFQTDLLALGDRLLAYIIKYVEANQGGLFIINDDNVDNQYLEMVACYAYNKKKHEEKTIKPGQGLIGQAFIEQKTVRLSNIPSEYVRITSGLGETTPSHLVIVPLKFNEQVLGVLEIAAFHELSDFKIKFLEQVGEIIASSISVVRTSQQTKLLLEESKQQTEEMKAQEEEMRQNMEELQATQEQQQRLQQELQENEKLLQGKLAELEVANTNSEQIRQKEKQRADEQIEARNKMMKKAMQKFKQREQELLAELEEAKK
ncbi:MAG: GAF domain-containing protein [Tunicatimonas sp.]|uniref:GAF domain-containing protein n=1 Tax=Tunicatimonas sp. TaxID=1940096 RepID=UPI003C719E31